MRLFISLQRTTKNRLNNATTRNKLQELAGRIDSLKSLGLTGRPCRIPEPEKVFEDGEERYQYQAKIAVAQRSGKQLDTNRLEFLKSDIQKRAKQCGWNLVSVKTNEATQSDIAAKAQPVFTPPMLTSSSIRTFFGHIHERDPHIRLIHDSVMTYVNSARKTRSHVLLHGKPASCKTTLFESFKKFYEQDGETRVVFIDGPTMSKAGLENWLIELADTGTIPAVICIEEIEKQQMDNLLMLLSVMASGYAMKTNARVGRLSKLVEAMIWATCNDSTRIRKFRQGAIWSRFTHRLYCGRPSRETMVKILERKVKERGGDPRWVDAVIQFAYDTHEKEFGAQITDPREIIGLLDGGRRLLDGSYQQDKIQLLKLEQEESELEGVQV